MVAVSLKLQDVPCICIGGGRIAERRIQRLLKAGARVTVISPTLTPTLENLVVQEKLIWQNKPYCEGCLWTSRLVIIATGDVEINTVAAREARRLGALINRVDAPEDCDFTFPAEVAFDSFTLSITTGRQSPRLNKLLRQEIEERYAPVASILPKLGQWRRELQRILPTSEAREQFWQTYFGKNELQLIIEGRGPEVEARIEHAISCLRIKS